MAKVKPAKAKQLKAKAKQAKANKFKIDLNQINSEITTLSDNIKKCCVKINKNARKVKKTEHEIYALLSGLNLLDKNYLRNVNYRYNDIVFHSFDAMVTNVGFKNYKQTNISNNVYFNNLDVLQSFNVWLRDMKYHNQLITFSVYNGNIYCKNRLVQYERFGKMYGLCMVTNTSDCILIERRISEIYREDFIRRNYV